MWILTCVSVLFGVVGTLSALSYRRKNYALSLKYSETKLCVVPCLAFPGPMDEMVPDTHYSESVDNAIDSLKTYLSVSVTNQSARPVTLFEIGFVEKDNELNFIENPDAIGVLTDGQWKWQRRYPIILKPDQECAIYERICVSRLSDINTIAYAKTDCGEKVEGTSPIMKSLRQRISKASGRAS